MFSFRNMFSVIIKIQFEVQVGCEKVEIGWKEIFCIKNKIRNRMLESKNNLGVFGKKFNVLNVSLRNWEVSSVYE